MAISNASATHIIGTDSLGSSARKTRLLARSERERPRQNSMHSSDLLRQ